MADFSLSFDSDNPFADADAAPKTAHAASAAEALAIDEAPNAPENAASTDVASADVASADDNAFPLSAFDFSFDDDAINDTLPTRTNFGSPGSPRQQTPGEAAFADFDFGTPAINATTSTIEPEMVEPEMVEDDLFAEPEFDASEVMESQPAKSQTTAPEFKPSNRIEKNAPSDLDEFNALAFGLIASTPEIAAENDTVESEPFGAEFPDFSADMFAPQIEEPRIEEPSADAQLIEEQPSDNPNFVEDSIIEGVIIESESDVVASGLATIPSEIAPLADVREDVAVAPALKNEARPRRTKSLLNVAILGASGIGKNHARWFHRNGCHISAFLGTSGDSTAKTEADLAQDFAFEGKAYTNLGELLAAEKPDIVCVATPPELHFAHVLQCLEAGAHVLCEKPLVYAPTRKFRENRDGAKELVKVAAKRNLVLGTQLQYGAATPILCKLAGLSLTDVGDFAMELETLNPNSPLEPRDLWIDLGPHPISVAQMLAGPGAKLAEETIHFEPFQNDEKTEVLARFGINCADGRLLMSRVVVRALRSDTRQPRRRFSFNGHSVTYAPLNNGKGNFQAQFVAPDGYASVYSDPVDYLIGDFVRACREQGTPLISGDFGRENMEWMLKVAGEK